MSLLRPLLAALVLLVAHPAGVPLQAQVATQPSTPRVDSLRARLQAVLDSVHRAGDFPGATAGVALADGTVIGLATGMADTARREAMTPEHRLLAGSVGKTFAAAVALQLVQEGRIDLDAKVSRYLGDEPWFARLPNAPDLTVRMLMNHTSGLVRYEFDERFLQDLVRDPYRSWTPADRFAYLLDAEPPFAAGSDWEYSDSNYILLGAIIERVTGQPYYAEMRRRLLDPLALDGTVPADGPVIAGLSQGYAGPDNFFGGWDEMLGADGRLVFNPQMEWTGGGVASTASDLALWARALYGGDVLPAEMTAAMVDGVPAKLGPDVRYGLGAIVRPTALGVTHGHSGFFPGYSTDVMYFAEHGVAVAVQVNTSARGKVPRTGPILVELARATGDPAAAPPSAVDSFTVRSAVLGEARKVTVWTPPAYRDPAAPRLPVLYMPDGGTDEDFPHVVATVDSLVSLGAIRPVIVIGIPNTERRRDLTGPTRFAEDSAIAPRVGGSATFRRFLRDELIPAVDARYRTTNERAIIGESLAGLFIVETFLVEPGLFDHYVALDPSLWWNGRALLDSAPSRLAAHDDARRQLHLVSSGEPEIAADVARLVDVLGASRPSGLTWRHVPRPDLTHGTVYRGMKVMSLLQLLGTP